MSNIKCFDANGDLLKRMYQWDVNQTILVTGLPDAVTIFHFCNAGSDEAYVVVPTVTDEGYIVKVPNVLLENEVPIIMYSYQETGDEAFRTTFMIHIPVIPRIKPADYEFEDNVDHMTLASVDARISRLINTVTGEGVEGDVSAEVIDMRDANDGHGEYETAGDALRAVSNRLTDLAEEHDEDMETIQGSLTTLNNDISATDTTANTALQAATNAENGVAEFSNRISTAESNIRQLQLNVENYVDGMELDGEGYVYLLHNGERISDRIGPFAGGGSGGGGGGSGGNNATLTVANSSGWASKTISSGSQCPIAITWSSIADELATGDGTVKITVNGIVKAILNVSQGTVNIDLAQYLMTGENSVRVRVDDVYGNNRTIIFSVNVVMLSVSSSFDASVPYSRSIAFPYTPVGAIEKTIHFIVDNVQIGTYTTSLSGNQLTYTIPQQTYGSHSIEVYFDCVINGAAVESNHLYYEIICTDSLSTAPIIVSPFNTTSVTQYTTMLIPYSVYTPTSMTSAVTITANGTQIASITVDRTQQTLSYRADTVGALAIVITSGSTSKTISLTVTSSGIDTEAETENLALYLSSYGRSNNEANPGTWTYGTGGSQIAATMSGFNWTSDGWVQDDDGITVLRVAGSARVTIPYKPFAQDFRSTGKTIEIEFATRQVLDYDSVIFSCWSGNRGIQITPQLATLRSEGSVIGMQYKEDDHVRLTFVCEKRSENRLLLAYINGIPSAVVQYPNNDDFSQISPVNISIGSSDCAVDIYCIRVYDNDLSRKQVLTNWIADSQNITDMLNRYSRNNVYDEYGNIIIAKLPSDLPYMILEAPQLPQYKGDKKTITGSYTDPVTPSNSFTFTGCQINVQGTSSAPYARKNYDLQFKQGFEMTASREHADNYALTSTVVPFDRFVLKADVASSEGANNVELVKLYCELTPFKTREMLANSKVRQGIYGFPIVVFWRDTTNDTTSFLGKYNFNFPKRAPGPYGYSGNMESWEFQNNTSDLMLFKSDYFDETMYTDPDTGDTKELWRYDYEARFPSDEWTDYTKLQELQSFIYSTYRANATGSNLSSAVTYDGVQYTKDTAAYRLAKFKAEFGNYAELSSFIFYYVFTEFFLMVDSRAKNLFIGFSGSDTDPSLHLAIDRKAVAEPYDMDTGLGTNNEGSLVFGYSLEDTDHLAGGANIFNGQDSVLWCNLRDAFGTEIRQMYQTLRSGGVLSYDTVEQRFEDHQNKWPVAVWIEDAWFKYIDPLINPDPGKEPTAVYLPMMQGSKEEQRKWWLSNRFRYMDSRWNAGDALSQVIQLRGYAKANITVTPYTDIYPTIKYASYLVQERGAHGQPTTLVCPLDNVNDTEIYIYSAPQIMSVGDLSGLKVGFADFSKATRLQEIKIGDSSQSYSNANLNNLTLGTNRLLKKLDVRNCTALGTGDQKVVDLSGCSNIEEVYFDGTAITSVMLPNGGVLKKLHLPNTITNLTIQNQTAITEFVMPSYANITTLRLENVSSTINPLTILNAIPANSRVRIVGLNWEASNAAAIESLLDTLDDMRGLDENGNNMDTAQVSGAIHTASLTGAQIASYNARYPYITITADHITSYLTYKSYDGATTLKTVTCLDGVPQDTAPAGPTRPATPANIFTFIGWSKSPNATTVDADAETNVLADRSIYAAYSVQGQVYQVRFLNGSTVLQTYDSVPYGGSVTYTGSEPQYTGGEAGDWVFNGWNPEPTEIQGNTDCYAQFRDASSPLIKYLKHTITSYESPTNTKIASNAFYQQNSLVSAKAPATTVETNAFNSCPELTTVELSGTAAATIAAQAFVSCPQLEAVIIRSTTMSTLANVNAFNGTKIYKGMGAIYVPSNLVATYRADNNWKNFAIISVDDYPSTDFSTISDSWAQIIAEPDYATKYAIGDTKKLTINGNDIYMQLAAVNTDDLADESGKAKMTWIAKNVAETHRMNATAVNTDGWADAEMRSWLNDTVLPTIDATVRNAMKPVTKTYYDKTSNSTLSTTDTLWIPSYREVGLVTSYESCETSGHIYSGLFTSTSATRIKYNTALTALNTTAWWLRSAYSSDAVSFMFVASSGNRSSYNANNNYGVVFSFCI